MHEDSITQRSDSRSFSSRCLQLFNFHSSLAQQPVPAPLSPTTAAVALQLFIFHTIKKYGPLVFATIQTVRQLLSIVLSIIFFGHEVCSGE